MGTRGEVPGLVELRSAHQRGLGALRCQPWGAEGAQPHGVGRSLPAAAAARGSRASARQIKEN